MNRSIEYVLSKLHASLDVFPTLMGTCGGLYVVEALEPLSYPHYLAKLSFGQWAQRVSVALGNIHILRIIFCKGRREYDHICAGPLLRFWNWGC